MDAEIDQMRTDYNRTTFERAKVQYRTTLATPPRSSPEYRDWFRAFLKGRATRASMPNNPGMTTAATGDNAGVLAPASFDNIVLKSLVYASSLLSRVRIWRSPTGSAAVTPTVYAAGGEQALSEATIAEDSAYTQADAVISRIVWGITPTWGTRDAIALSRALLQDSGIDVELLVAELFAGRLMRGVDTACWTTIKAATWTTVVTSGSNAAPTYADLLSLYHSVDPAFRTPTAAFYMPDATVKLIRSIADTTNARPLLVDAPSVFETTDPSLFGGSEPQTVRQPLLFGHPVVSTRSLTTWGAAATNAMCFGDFTKGAVLRYVGCNVQTLLERYADYGAVGLVGRLRADFATADPAAVATLTVHA